MSFLDIINYFSAGDSVGGKYTISRFTSRAYGTDGKLLPLGAPTTLLIVAGIQPTSGREQLMLQEAGIVSESKKVFTEIPLLTRRPGQEPDEITIAGEQWTAYIAIVWEGFAEVVYQTLVARKATE